MIKKIGIDIVENSRIKLTQVFLEKFLSAKELLIIESFENEQRKLEFAAGRWAVKEAIIKTLDIWISPTLIDIGYHNKRPVILTPGMEAIHVSISHETNYAVGMAVREDD
ncbi:ACP synthase [Mesoplasma syrphidae]|uniref:ACP synthase n=1 Tax=Mesoplasma syrphidae TaxID=225999 RepID=A0A2K9CCV4_9MOLU|nr:4'-phosphopantetheinyl transferase superfamily protein [Mesoplasma syrphidae]AUF83484.1 ACP synthase [Mesoplasma syrphidae]